MKNNTNKKMLFKGFSIVEILVAMGIIIIISVTGVTTILHSFSMNRLGDEKTEAIIYASEGMEALKSIKNQDYYSIVAGTYGFDNSGGLWAFQGSSNTNGKFTRQVTVESVSRDSSEDIVTSGGFDDPNTKKITSTVTWDFSPTRSNTITLMSYFTNYNKIVVGDWSNATENSGAGVDISGNNDGLKIQVQDDYAYIIRDSGTPNFAIIDISSPTSSSVTDSLSLSGDPFNIAVFGNYAYVTTDDTSS